MSTVLSFVSLFLINCFYSQTAVIGNGYVILGVHALGELNVPYVGNILGMPASDPTGIRTVGLRNGALANGSAIAGDHASTEPGCKCEGWGIRTRGATTGIRQGGANQNNYPSGVGLRLESFAGSHGGTTAVSTVTDTAARYFRVTHDYHPSPLSTDVYEVLVTIENISGEDLEVSYIRTMDWDIYPTAFREYVTVEGVTTTTNLVRSHNNGFSSVLSFGTSSPRSTSIPTLNVDFVDAGPSDHGAHFEFNFGTVKSGDKYVFKTFYGVASGEERAENALADIGAELWSFGQSSNVGNQITGLPYTFIFAFSGVGGVVVPPRCLITCLDPQKLFLGDDCKANVPDYTALIGFSAGCGLVNITQHGPTVLKGVTQVVINFTIETAVGPRNCSVSVETVDTKKQCGKFLFFPQPMTCTQAHRFCKDTVGTELAIIETPECNTEAQLTCGTHSCWIQYTENISSLASYHKFDQLNHPSFKDCVLVCKGTGYWEYGRLTNGKKNVGTLCKNPRLIHSGNSSEPTVDSAKGQLFKELNYFNQSDSTFKILTVVAMVLFCGLGFILTCCALKYLKNPKYSSYSHVDDEITDATSNAIKTEITVDKEQN